MKKTKKGLIECLREVLMLPGKDVGECFADKLIQEGWVELDEPREWWDIIKTKDGQLISRHKTEKEAEDYYKSFESFEQMYLEIIHVREVEND